MQVKLKDSQDKDLWKTVREAEETIEQDGGSSEVGKWTSSEVSARAELKVSLKDLGLNYLIAFMRNKNSGKTKIEVDSGGAERTFKLQPNKLGELLAQVKDWAALKADTSNQPDFLPMTARQALAEKVEDRVMEASKKLEKRKPSVSSTDNVQEIATRLALELKKVGCELQPDSLKVINQQGEPPEWRIKFRVEDEDSQFIVRVFDEDGDRVFDVLTGKDGGYQRLAYSAVDDWTNETKNKLFILLSSELKDFCDETE